MTAQIGDLLFYQGQRMTICDAPLGTYFRLGGAYPEFEPSSTALMRGYVATWELLDDRLYLVAIQGWLSDGADASLESVFRDIRSGFSPIGTPAASGFHAASC
ncbi:hypothetical protein UMZ34_19935 [Halopseudomonas pachastrellae]|nr:hypothetical protein UMZ34_19935 [Halopseudomonas pachastrellae]